ELRQPDRPCLLRDDTEMGVERSPGTRCEARVAMARNGSQHDRNSGRVALVAAGDPRQARSRIDVGDVESPGEQIRKRSPSDLRRRARAVAAEHCDPDGTGVEPFGVCANDRSVDTAVPTLEHLPVLVDEKVVTDVVPAVALDVVDLDPPYDRRGLRSGI